jgi:hypothetical protein
MSENGLESQSIIALEHCWIEINNHVYHGCKDCDVDIRNSADVARSKHDTNKRKNMRRLRNSCVFLELIESIPFAVEEMLFVITRGPKSEPQDFSE